MGADIQILSPSFEGGEPTADLLVRHSSLHGTVIEGELIPTLIDEIPIIAILAACAQGTTVIRNAEELKVKESNRLRIMVDELTAMGCDIEETEDGMIIHGGKPLQGAIIDSRLDHRIAMSFAVAGLVAEGTTQLLRSDCVNISYPNFYEELRKMIIDSRLDHRIAMSFAVAGLVAEGTTQLLRSDCVNISYPNFYEELRKMMI